jgi:hypothetical protein
MWYMLAIWGWTSYYEKLPSGYFEDELNSHFDKDCSMLYKVWQSASGVIPIVNSTHWHDFDFQWYPEACCMYHKLPEDKIVFADIYEFMEGKSEPGSDYLSVKEYCELLIDGKQAKKKTPFDAAEDIFALSQHVLDNLAELKFEAKDSNELTFTVDDLEALAYLGMYYGLKIKAAMLLRMYKYDLDLKGKTQAVTLLKEAAQYWRKYSSKSKMMYKPQVLTRLLGYVDVARFDELCDLDVLLAQEL